MNSVKKIIIACCAVVLVAVSGVIVCLTLSSEKASAPTSVRATKTPKTALNDAISRAKVLIDKNKSTKSNKKRLTRTKITYNDRTDLSATEKRQLNAIQNALDKEDLAALLAVLPDASKSPNAEVRNEMVDALGWFGEEAMLELLPFMADRDEDVAQSALDSWTTSLSEIEDEKEKATLIESAMLVIRDEDGLESMVMELDDCDELVAMQTVINLIESHNPKAVRVAREHYEFMTGDEYTSLEAAEKWMYENYEMENKDGSVSTMAEREAARTKATMAKTTSKSSSSRRSSSSSSSRVTTGSASETAGESTTGLGGEGAGGDAEEGVSNNIGDNPESTTDDIIGDSNKLLEEEGGLDTPEDGEELVDEDGNPIEGAVLPAQ